MGTTDGQASNFGRITYQYRRKSNIKDRWLAMSIRFDEFFLVEQI